MKRTNPESNNLASCSTPTKQSKVNPSPIPQNSNQSTNVHNTLMTNQQMQYYPYQMHSIVDPQYAAQFTYYYNQMYYQQPPRPQTMAQPPLPPPKILTSQPPPPIPKSPATSESSLSPKSSQENPSSYSSILLGSAQRHMNNPNTNINTRRIQNPIGSKYNSNINNKGNSNLNKSNQQKDDMTINKKAKRKPMSTRYTRKKEWDRDDAIKAIQLEQEYNKSTKAPTLVLRFPDPELNKDVVRKFSPNIDLVHFQNPSVARFCFVTLRPNTDIRKEIEELSKITFGVGKITVKLHHSDEKLEVLPEEIDPYTLYIGNLPTNITVAAVKERFPTAQRIDIGYAQRMKYTRYAFIRYKSIEDSTSAFRKTFNLVMESRSLIVRFRRQKGNVGLPGEVKTPKPKQISIQDSIIPNLENNDFELNQSSHPSMTTNTQNDQILDNSTTLGFSNSVENISNKRKNDERPVSPIDSKDDVLENAKKLLESKEVNKDMDLNINNINMDDLLGIQVKKEPIEHNEIFEESGDNDEEDDEDEEEDYDEDDVCDDNYDDNEEEEYDEEVSKYHWSRLQQEEALNEKEEKPNIHELNSLIDQQNKEKSDEQKKPGNIPKPTSEYDDLFDVLNATDDGF